MVIKPKCSYEDDAKHGMKRLVFKVYANSFCFHFLIVVIIMFSLPWILSESKIPDLDYAISTTCEVHMTTRVRQLPAEIGSHDCRILDYIASNLSERRGTKYFRLLKNHLVSGNRQKMLYINDAYTAWSLGFKYLTTTRFEILNHPYSLLPDRAEIYANEIILSPLAHQTDYILESCHQYRSVVNNLTHTQAFKDILSLYKEEYETVRFPCGNLFECNCYHSNSKLSWIFSGQNSKTDLCLIDAVSFDVVVIDSSDIEPVCFLDS